MEDRPVVRIGDAEREAVLEALGEHHARGRLSVEELDRRQRAALTAVTQEDLANLLVDLPQIRPETPAPDRGESRSSTPARLRDSEEVRALVIWAPPTGMTLGAAAWVATAGPFPEESSMFAMALGMATVGFVSHWWVSRRRG